MTREDILREYEEILTILTEFFGDQDRAVLWMSSPNHLLGDVRPAEYVINGRAPKLKKFIQYQISENAA